MVKTATLSPRSQEQKQCWLGEERDFKRFEVLRIVRVTKQTLHSDKVPVFDESAFNEGFPKTQTTLKN